LERYRVGIQQSVLLKSIESDAVKKCERISRDFLSVGKRIREYGYFRISENTRISVNLCR
jgi:hypothetical protein